MLQTEHFVGNMFEEGRQTPAFDAEFPVNQDKWTLIQQLFLSWYDCILIPVVKDD